jgi:putative transposase
MRTVAIKVNAEGYHEILGVQVSSAADGAGWLAFFRDLVGLATASAPTPPRTRAHRRGLRKIGGSLRLLMKPETASVN